MSLSTLDITPITRDQQEFPLDLEQRSEDRLADRVMLPPALRVSVELAASR